jgi:hypothetical protein
LGFPLKARSLVHTGGFSEDKILGIFKKNENAASMYLSKRPEILIVTENQAALTTEFEINFYNSSAPTNFNKHRHVLRGSWSVRANTAETLSCTLVSDGTSFSLLQFDSQAGTFERWPLDPAATTNWNTLLSNSRFSLK